MSLAGNGWMGLWLASYVAGLAMWPIGCLAGWLVGFVSDWLAMWLAGCVALWLAGWLACYGATYVVDWLLYGLLALQLGGHEADSLGGLRLASQALRLTSYIIAGWLGGYGCTDGYVASCAALCPCGWLFDSLPSLILIDWLQSWILIGWLLWLAY